MSHLKCCLLLCISVDSLLGISLETLLCSDSSSDKWLHFVFSSLFVLILIIVVEGPVSFRWSSVPTCSFGSRNIVMHKKVYYYISFLVGQGYLNFLLWTTMYWTFNSIVQPCNSQISVHFHVWVCTYIK